jgi:NADP-dependent 3-hydroxy acid dehydrogenase YdfG
MTSRGFSLSTIFPSPVSRLPDLPIPDSQFPIPDVAIVTGGGRGVGRGVAAALHDAGMRVYATGRTVESAVLPTGVVRVACDHTDDDAVAACSRASSETPVDSTCS